MILREIYLYPDLTAYPREFTSGVRFATRSVCNYLERCWLKPLKLQADFKRICVIGSADPRMGCMINSEKVLSVEVSFSSEKWERTQGSARHEYHIALLIDGLTKIGAEHSLPIPSALACIDDFRRSHYTNKWLFKAKEIHPIGVRCELWCELTLEVFRLHLQIFRGDALISSEQVLETLPDELIYAHKFKDVVFVNDTLAIVDSSANRGYEVAVAKILGAETRART